MEVPYSLEEYIWIRGQYLRTLPQFTYLGDAVQSHVRQAVSDLFPHDPEDIIPTATAAQLFAMEVANGITPFTPLLQRIDTSQTAPGPALPSPVATTPPRFSSPTPPATAHTTADGQSVQASLESLPANASEEILGQPSPQMPAPRPQEVDQVPPPLPDNFEQGNAILAPAQNMSPIVPPAMHLPKTVPAPGIQAMSNRPVHNPVKISSRGKRDIKKVNYAQDPLPNDKFDDADDAEEKPPTKKARKTAAKSASSTAKIAISKAEAKQSLEEPKIKKSSRQAEAPAKKQISAVLAIDQIPASARIDPAFMIVVNGHAPPHNRDQARYAQGMRKHLLMAEYGASGAYTKDKKARDAAHKPKKGKKKAINPAPEFKPDLMPEFFEVSNFAKGEDAVRCVCEVNEDHEEYNWIACDTCNAWQHDGCMGEAVPTNKKDRYYCHVCDPYGHRVLLQRVRQAHAVRA